MAAHGYIAESFDTFGLGLNLSDKEDAVNPGEAIDALNVEFTTRGAVKQRQGYANFATSLTEAPYSMSPYYNSTGTRQLIVGGLTKAWALNVSGSVVATSSAYTGGTATIWSFARFAAPGSQYLYASNSSVKTGGSPFLTRWNGSTWTEVLVSTLGANAGWNSMAVLSPSNRLAIGGFGPAAAAPQSPSTVNFSDAGAPETFSANNYIQVTPGDGEAVIALIAWQNFVFIFKETKFAVVYGESVDAGGNPIFDYRIVDTGVGAVGQRAVCAAPDGVYFCDRTGVYRTTGEAPERVSQPLDSLFDGTTASFWNGGSLYTGTTGSLDNMAMGAIGKRIYLAYSTGANTESVATPSGSQTVGVNDRTLVFDPTYNWWTLYDWPARCFATLRTGNPNEIMMGLSTANTVARSNSLQSTDAGTAVNSYWQSGFFDYGLGQEKTIRETKAWGTGTVQVSTIPDFNAYNGTRTASSTLTFAPASGQALDAKMSRVASRGTVFSNRLANNSSGPWSIHRLENHLREQRILSTLQS